MYLNRNSFYQRICYYQSGFEKISGDSFNLTRRKLLSFYRLKMSVINKYWSEANTHVCSRSDSTFLWPQYVVTIRVVQLSLNILSNKQLDFLKLHRMFFWYNCTFYFNNCLQVWEFGYPGADRFVRVHVFIRFRN